jgi:hypothetical protein
MEKIVRLFYPHFSIVDTTYVLDIHTQELIINEDLNMKDQRGRPEGGGEWEPIKISRKNLAYILESTRDPSLLTRLRPPSYR